MVYQLHGDLLVQDSTLIIEAGTRIEASPGVSIVIGRAGRIDARGTATEPIIMTCATPALPGCWNGVVIEGAARVNSGTPTSPIIPGRDGTGGCLEVTAPGGAYGGCEDNDSSGVFQYVWIENAGAGAGAGLSLRAVGARTAIANVHVFQSAGTGIDLRGGAVDLRYVRVTIADSAGLAWSEGWRGRAQFGIVQSKSGARAALEGGNSAASPNAVPRSAPVLRNFTIIGPVTADTGSGAAGVRLHSGSAAVLQSLVVSRQPATAAWALDIDDDATWALVDNGEIRFESSFLMGFAPLGAPDADPPRAGFFSPDIEGQLLRLPGAHNRVLFDFDSLANQLKAPYGALQDLRSTPGGLLFNWTCNPLPDDPFFRPVTYCGAVESAAAALIPWNEPGPVAALPAVAPNPPFGHLHVHVFSNEIGPLGGVTVRANNYSAVTDAAGHARLYVPNGFQSYQLDNLPAGCSNPGLFLVNVPPAGSIGQAALIGC